MYIVIFQRLFLLAILDIFYFPIWWYTKGAIRGLRAVWGLAKDGNARLAPGLWLKNIFVPMFGQYDWQGRMVSFFMRSVQIVFRSVALVGWFFLCVVLWLAWLSLPAVAFYGIVIGLMAA